MKRLQLTTDGTCRSIINIPVLNMPKLKGTFIAEAAIVYIHKHTHNGLCFVTSLHVTFLMDPMLLDLKLNIQKLKFSLPSTYYFKSNST